MIESTIDKKKEGEFIKELKTLINKHSIENGSNTPDFLLARYFLIPDDFGEYGHYRTSAVTNIITQEIQYAGHQICYECHDDIVDEKQLGYHKKVNCEVCHGPAAEHVKEEGDMRVLFRFGNS